MVFLSCNRTVPPFGMPPVAPLHEMPPRGKTTFERRKRIDVAGGLHEHARPWLRSGELLRVWLALGHRDIAGGLDESGELGIADFVPIHPKSGQFDTVLRAFILGAIIVAHEEFAAWKPNHVFRNRSPGLITRCQHGNKERKENPAAEQPRPTPLQERLWVGIPTFSHESRPRHF